MARERRRRAKAEANSGEPLSSQDKIARLVGLFLIKDIEQKIDQVTLLRSAGFQVSEVAAMLGISEKHVTVATHKGRKKKSRNKVNSKTR